MDPRHHCGGGGWYEYFTIITIYKFVTTQQLVNKEARLAREDVGVEHQPLERLVAAQQLGSLRRLCDHIRRRAPPHTPHT